MCSYTKEERPVRDDFEPVQLNFGLSLQQIIDMDEKQQLLRTNMWLKMEWTDYNLVWNAVTIKHITACC